MDYTINHNKVEERQQINASNKKAFAISCLLYALLIISLFFIKRKEPPMVEVAGVSEIEVNIGNVDNALGDDQGLIPNMPSNTEITNPVATQATVPTEQENNITSEDNGDVATSLKPKSSKPKKQIVEKKATKNTPAKVINQQQNPPVEETPPAPIPKAVMGAFNKNNTSTGGNQADSYKKGGNQGNTQGNGDMGMLGGAENGVNAPVSFSIVKGLSNRNIVYLPQYSDDFNKEGTVRVRVSFGNNGSATGASFYLPGSNTSDKTLINLALKRAKAIKLNQDASAPIEQEAIFEFVFKIR